MIADVAPDLHTFFVPQMEQLGLREIPTRCGSLSVGEGEWGRGTLWVASVGDGCLISVHDVQVNETFTLYEFPDDFTCLASMSRACTAATQTCSPLPSSPTMRMRERNFVSFRQAGGKVRYEMAGGQRYVSSTITFTPRFFDELSRIAPDGAAFMAETLASAPANTLPDALNAVLRSFNPTCANLAHAPMHITSKVMEAVSLIMGNATKTNSLGHAPAPALAGARGHNSAPTGSSDAADIAQQAKAYLGDHLGEPLTLQAVADALFVSRTHLCTAFKQATGASVGAYLHGVRMQRACELLRDTTLPVAEVSRAVGYARQSSFAEAFKEDAGITPTEWRKKVRA
ncbi:MAG: AraC family transcriptional regulator [Eggerthellaceae bacterium]|nr:AraC family transcriptional regulator [Eggerthellaceae bacterium]